MNIKSKNVLVTGGAGFIGINLVQNLLSEGFKVTILDLESANFSSVPKKVGIIKANILDKKSFADKLKNFDIIFHLAARTDLDGKVLSDYKVNYVGTENIIEEIKNQQVQRFVLYSTQLVVGLTNQRKFLNETEPYTTKTFYGQSKIMAEKKVVDLCNKYKLPYTIIRPTSVYGPFGKQPYRDFFLAIKRGKYFHIGKADNLVSMVFVKNLTYLTIQLSTNKLARNQIFYGNDLYPYTMNQFATEVSKYFNVKVRTIPTIIATIAAYFLGVLKIFGFDPPLYPSRVKNIKATYCYDMTKAIKLGYNPKYDLASSMRLTLDWYKDNDSSYQL